MSRLCLSSTRKTRLSNSIQICSFILSHPFYLSYLIFFSTFLLKLLSFFSLLFITTCLILLALLTISPRLIERLRPNIDDENKEFHYFEDFESFKIGFNTSPLDGRGNSVEFSKLNSEETRLQFPKEKSIQANQVKATNWPIMVETRLEMCVEESDIFEDAESDLVLEDEQHKPKPPMIKIGSEAVSDNLINITVKLSTDSGKTSPFFDTNIGNYGSMRKEKEWKRTLACKLFEERHNVDGGDDGMDSLWETYERDSSKAKAKNNKKMGKEKKSKMEYYYEDQEDNDDEGRQTNGKLCCLQALKFSSGRKMSLGMGRPNLVRISKALKGFNWLHYMGKHGKKT